MEYVAFVATFVVLGLVVVLVLRSVKRVTPGWRYEIRVGRTVVRVLDKPGIYFVGPLFRCKKVRADDHRLRL